MLQVDASTVESTLEVELLLLEDKVLTVDCSWVTLILRLSTCIWRSLSEELEAKYVSPITLRVPRVSVT